MDVQLCAGGLRPRTHFRSWPARLSHGSSQKWNEDLLMLLTPWSGKPAMQRIKHPPIRNKIELADRAQVRAWTRRLGISADALKVVVEKVGNSVAAVAKEVELQRAATGTPSKPSAESPPAEGEPAPA